MRKAGWLAITTLVLVIPLAGSIAAAGPGRGSCGPASHGPKIEHMSKCLDLTEEQTKEIENILSGRRSESLSVRNELTRATHELKGEMLKTHPDISTVRNLTGKIGDLKGKIHLVAIERQLAIRKILTDEQIEIMIACRGMGGFGHEGKGRGSRFGSGPGGPACHGDLNGAHGGTKDIQRKGARTK